MVLLRKTGFAWIAVILVLLVRAEVGVGQSQGPGGAVQIFTSDSLIIDWPALSPDGKWIAFAASTTPDWRSLFVVPSGGGDPVRLTEGLFNDTAPAWSPDGTILYFNSDRTRGPESGTLQLMRVPFEPERGQTAGLPRLVVLDEVISFAPPAVSPDGQWIAYLTEVEGPRPNWSVRAVPAQGGSPLDLARINFGQVGWASDSRSVVYAESGAGSAPKGLFRAPLDGDSPQLLFSVEDGSYLVSVSGDGQRFLWSLSSPVPGAGASYEVWDSDGNLVAGLEESGNVATGSLSFDGSSLFYRSNNRAQALVVTPLNGGPTRTLKEGPCSNEPHGWTADGRILVVSECGWGLKEEDQAFLISSGGGNREEVSLPFERGHAGLIHPDGRHVRFGFLMAGPENPLARYSERVIVDLVTGAIQELSKAPVQGLIYGPLSEGIDGDRFLFVDGNSGSYQLMTVRPGEPPEPLWTYPEDLVGEGFQGIPRVEAVGVQGDRIAWIRSNYDGELHPGIRSTLLVTDAAQGITTEVISVDGHLGSPVWSPDGRTVSMYYTQFGTDDWRFAIIELDHQMRPIGDFLFLNPGARNYLGGGWTPDSENLIYYGMGVESLIDGAILLIRVIEGSEAVNLTAFDPAPWFPYSLSPDGTLLAYPSDRLIGSSIWRVSLEEPEGGSPRR